MRPHHLRHAGRELLCRALRAGDPRCRVRRCACALRSQRHRPARRSPRSRRRSPTSSDAAGRSSQDELAAVNEQINGLIAQVSEARQREEAAAAELAETEERTGARPRPTSPPAASSSQRVREQLRAAIDELEKILVGVYKSDDPDDVKLLIESSEWEDASVDAAYLDRVHEYQADTIQRVEDLRAEAEATVERLADAQARIAEARDEVAARAMTPSPTQRAALEAAGGRSSPPPATPARTRSAA